MPNFSFENGTANWTQTVGSGTFGVSQPTAASGAGFAPSNGSNAGFVYVAGNSGATEITTSASLGTIAANTTYTLTVAVGNEANRQNNQNAVFFSNNIALLANGVVIPSAQLTRIAPASGTMRDYVVSFSTGASGGYVGKVLTIQLGEDNGAPNGNYSAVTFDNVRLMSGPNFVHPAIDYTQADLDRIKNNCLNVEPYKSAFPSYTSTSYFSSTNPGGGADSTGSHLRDDAAIAKCNADMWYITGNSAYLTNSINIMNSYATTLTNFDVYDHLTAGQVAKDFCNAGEIVRASSGGAWSAANIAAFQKMLLSQILPALLTPGNVIIYPPNLEYAGHGIVQVEGLVPLGIFCDRQDVFNAGITAMLANGTVATGIQEYIDVSGQNYETARDQGHASGALGTYTQIARWAWNQGIDLFVVGNNLLAKGYEMQARIDMGYDVPVIPYTAKDGGYHNSLSPDYRTINDGLKAPIAYHFYHDIKGLDLPYTYISMSNRGVDCFDGWYPTGPAPVPAAFGAPAPVDVVVGSDYGYTGTYQVHLSPGSYTKDQLSAKGVNGGPWGNGSQSMRSIKMPVGWSVTAYDGDNFTGNSIVLTGANVELGSVGWSQRIVSLKATQGAGAYPIYSGTYQLVARNSGMAANVNGTANGTGLVQNPYTMKINQLWSVQNLGNDQYQVVNLNSGKVMEVSGASLSNGATVDQSTYVGSGDLALGGTASASHYGTQFGEVAANAFDGNYNNRWTSPTNGQLEWLQIQLPSVQVINQYVVATGTDSLSRAPSAWQLQGSNNGTTWVTLDSQTAQTFSYAGASNVYNFTNTTAYSYYRFNMTAITGGSNASLDLAELALYNTKTALHQKWTFSAVSGSALGSYFTIPNVNSGQLLDVSGNSSAANASIIQWPSTGGANQQWSLQLP